MKHTFLILNFASLCQWVKQRMKVYPVHSKSGNTLNVTGFVFVRADRQTASREECGTGRRERPCYRRCYRRDPIISTCGGTRPERRRSFGPCSGEMRSSTRTKLYGKYLGTGEWMTQPYKYLVSPNISFKHILSLCLKIAGCKVDT